MSQNTLVPRDPVDPEPATEPVTDPATELDPDPLELPDPEVAARAGEDPGEQPGRHRPRRLLPHPTEWLLTGAFGGCVLLLAYAYRVAATPGSDPMAPFAPFWAALLIWLGVACWVLFRPGSTPFQRSFTLLVTGLLMSVPKLLRNPDRPLFFDEIAHWSQTEYLSRTGQIDSRNVVSILADYPGLHAMTAALRQVTHLSSWQVGVLLVLVLRAVTPLLVRELARSARLPARTADLAGLVYTLNPGFLFFTGMYAYESAAIVFELAALAIALRVLISGRDQTGAHVRVLLVLAGAATVTHHLSSLFMALAVLMIPLVSVGSWATARGRRRLLITAAQVAAVVAGWTLLRLGTVWDYLVVFPRLAAAQLTRLLDQLLTGLGAGSDGSGAGAGAGSGTRSLLSDTGLPRYETLLALTSVPLVLALAGYGVWLTRDRQRSTALRTLIAIGLLYPLSMPLVLTVSGSPGAHRSWPFSYQGLAVLIAVAVAHLAAAARPGARTLRRIGATIVLGGLLVGNTASENHDVLRFPGRFVLGTEGRAQSPELIATATWSGDHLRDTGTVLSDYFTGGYISAFGRAPVAAAFPAWDLLFYPGPPKGQTVDRLGPEGVGFLVVDRRLSTGLFRTGFYIDASEPDAGVRTAPIPAAALLKFEAYPWMPKVYSSTDYDVYRFDLTRWQNPLLLPARKTRGGLQ